MTEKKLFTVLMGKIAADADFAAKVKSLRTPEELIALAKTVGVALSEAQAQNGMECIQNLVQEDSELDDDMLGGVSGGASRSSSEVSAADALTERSEFTGRTVFT